MPTEFKSNLAAKLCEATVANAKAGRFSPASSEVRRRIVWAAERYAELADSVATKLTDAAKRIREAKAFTEPRSATAWCGGLEDLVRLRGEIDALTTALEIVEHFEESTGVEAGSQSQ